MKPISKTAIGGAPKLPRLLQAARVKNTMDPEPAQQLQDELCARASTAQDLASMTKFTCATSRAEIVARLSDVEEKASSRDKIDRILSRFDKLATLDPRPMLELIEYDELGLPK